ncbi:MAG: 50S ribosomal protein L33 [Candidatus Woykebacteria bacterium]
MRPLLPIESGLRGLCQNTQDKLELKKFCKNCRKATLHREVK